MQGIGQENSSPKPLIGKKPQLFYKKWSAKSEILEVVPGRLSRGPVRKEGRDPGAGSVI